MCSKALHNDFHAPVMLEPQTTLVFQTQNRGTVTTDIVYRSPCFTLCYGWRVGIVHPKCHCKRIRDDRYRGGQLVTLPYLTLPYLKLLQTIYIILP